MIWIIRLTNCKAGLNALNRYMRYTTVFVSLAFPLAKKLAMQSVLTLWKQQKMVQTEADHCDLIDPKHNIIQDDELD